MAKKAEKQVIIRKQKGKPDTVQVVEPEPQPVRQRRVNPFKIQKGGIRLTPKTPRLT